MRPPSDTRGRSFPASPQPHPGATSDSGWEQAEPFCCAFHQPARRGRFRPRAPLPTGAAACFSRRRLACGAPVGFFLRREQHGRACGGIWEPDPGAASCANTDCRGKGRARAERKGPACVPGGGTLRALEGRGGSELLRMLSTSRMLTPLHWGSCFPESVFACSQCHAARAPLSGSAPVLGPFRARVSGEDWTWRPPVGDILHLRGLTEDTGAHSCLWWLNQIVSMPGQGILLFQPGIQSRTAGVF